MNKVIFVLLPIVLFCVSGCGSKVPESTMPVREVLELNHAKPVATPPHATFTAKQFRLDEEVLVEAEKKYGIVARQRLEDWEKFIRTDKSTTDMEKLKKVNAYFNKINVIDDDIHWDQQDYWATPIEFLASDGGDCEDFSIAKYFTLKAMGIHERRLYLTYVKNLNVDDFHMVVTYYEVPGIKPLVLDNMIDDIKTVAQRTDLLPVYSFNDVELWTGQMRMGQLVGTSDQISRWKEMLTRMPEGLL